MKKFAIIALSATCCVLGSSTAMAAFVSDYNKGILLGSWSQSLTPVPVAILPGHETDVTIYNGTGAAMGVTTAFWYNQATQGGGLLVGNPISSPINTTGPQSYTGNEAAPVFVPGVYVESDGSIVTISVPEPATWATMLVGLGMIGFAVRRRRNVAVTDA